MVKSGRMSSTEETHGGGHTIKLQMMRSGEKNKSQQGRTTEVEGTELRAGGQGRPGEVALQLPPARWKGLGKKEHCW